MTFKRPTKLALVLLGALWLPVPASGIAQSLAEVARQVRKEREAREKEGKVPVKVFTNDDISRLPAAATSDSAPPRPSTTAGPPAPETKPPESAQPPAGGAPPAAAPVAQPGQAKDRVKSREYWQARFKAVRAALARAREEQALVEDEIQLLQIQQARELNPDLSRKLNSRIDASTLELQAKRAATEKAQQTLDKIEKEFKNSGAPPDWIPDKTGSD